MSVDSLISISDPPSFNRAGSHALHACADPEHFFKGGSEDQTDATKNERPSAHQRNAIVDDGPPLNAGLVPL